MAYIGRGIENLINAQKLDAITPSTATGVGPYNLTKASVAFVPASADALVVSINGVVQYGNFTVNSSTITFSGALTSADVCDFIYQMGTGLLSTPADGTVNTVQLANDAVTTSKILDNNVTVAKLPTTLDISGNTVTLPASVSGLGTGITNAQLAGSIDVTSKLSGLVPVANLGTGTASATTYLAGDQSYQTITEFNDNKIVNDISTLALHQATNNNSTKYNLTNSNVDVYQDSSAIANLVNVSRNTTGEYISTLASSTGPFTSDSNTLALLHMDGSDNGTTFTDSSSHGRIITRTGSPVTKTSIKKFGTSSCYFGDGDGTSGSHGNALSMPDSSSWDFLTSPWTIECWTYLLNPVSASGNTAFGFGGQSNSDSSDAGGNYNFDMNNQQQMRHNSYQRNGSNTNDDYNFETSATIGLNVWKHLAWVRDGNTVRLYIDGVQSSSHSIPSSVSYRLTQNDLGGKWWISKRPYNNNYGYIRGYVDEYRISNNTRYPNGTTFTPNTVDVTNVTGNYESTAQTANASVSTISGVVTYTNATGTATLNTDIILQVSADNGSTWQSAALTAAGTFSTGVLQAVTNDITVAAGTQIKYKMSFANQASATKVTRINGVSLSY